MLLGCGESSDEAPGGNGGSAGAGGEGGGSTCSSDAECDDGDACTADTCGIEGACEYENAEDGSPCAGGSCVVGSCEPVDDVFACTEQGIRDAVAQGGGPNGIACDGPQTVTTEAEILIDNDVILEGFGNLTVDGNETHRVFSIGTDITAELRRLSVTRGSAAAGSGGAILSSGNATLVDIRVTESTALRFGGGIANFGEMRLLDSQVSANSAGENGGGVFNTLTLAMTDTTVSGNSATLAGGGVGNTGSSLLIDRCTLSGNQAIQNGGGIANSNVLMIANSTLSGNSATSSGGGIRNESIMTMQHVTASGNTAMAGSAIGNAGVIMTMSGSVIDGECAGTAVGSSGYNIESPGDTCSLDQMSDVSGISASALGLGPLRDNGGATETHALMGGSAALDRIPPGYCEVDEDQRGVARPQGDQCDVGAFELEP